MGRSDATNAGLDDDEDDWLGITPPPSTQAPHLHAIGRQEGKPKGLKAEWPRDCTSSAETQLCFLYGSNVNGDDDWPKNTSHVFLVLSLVVELT